MNVLDVAKLARIDLTEEEAARYQEQMDKVLSYVEQLDQIDVEGIEPTAHAAAVFDVIREDVATGTSIDREKVLANAPDTALDQIKMPKVIE